MKTKGFKTNGFTLIELIVAMTLVAILTQMATTTAYNFIQSVNAYRGQFETLRDGINGLYATVSLAKMTYEADLALAVANGVASPNDTDAQAALGEAKTELKYWNDSANQNNPSALINVLLKPNSLIKKSPGSYLPPFNTVLVWRNNNGNWVQDTETPPITNYDSLRRAFLLTDNRTPDQTRSDGSNNPILATLTLGRILDVSNLANPISPTLPQIDWKRGTQQEILFPPPQTM